MTELQMGARHKPVIFLQFITNLPLLMLWVSFMSGFQHLDFYFFFNIFIIMGDMTLRRFFSKRMLRMGDKPKLNELKDT